MNNGLANQTDPLLRAFTGMMTFTKAAARRPSIRIATLGPTGTSSEFAARCFLENISAGGGECRLFGTYEESAESVEAGSNDLLIVANAYSGINRFYISTTLSLASFFLLDTPEYGLAIRSDTSAAGRHLSIVSHPAPAHLIPWFCEDAGATGSVDLVNSTSEAADLVSRGLADACLTNNEARVRYGLEFCSMTRPIRMLWSVFKRSESDEFPDL